MTILMTKEMAVDWARRLVEENPGNLSDPDDLLDNHLPMTYDIARETAERIAENCTFDGERIVEFDIDAVALAGGLHDIGRPLGNKDREGQEYHEIRGYWEIRANGLDVGVANTQEEVNLVASYMLPHGSVFETFVDGDYADIRENFFSDYHGFVEKFGEITRRQLTPASLMPNDLGPAIVDYAELSNARGERVDYRERLENAIERYKAKGDPRAACIVKGSKRRIASADIIQVLANNSVGPSIVKVLLEKRLE